MSSEAAVDVVALLRDKRISNLSGLTMDSRQVKPGDIFVAVSGIESHGLEYLSTAISAGASAVLWEDDAEWS
ncbi:MAG: hypothetical protein HOM11_01370, partial [Methylococcales bacterium]|nr:hypothetical protein [Methylococcales bacterium]